MSEHDVCSHGQLRRQCELCERDDVIAELRSRLGRLRRTVEVMRQVASMWSDSVYKLKRQTLESFALEIERMIEP